MDIFVDRCAGIDIGKAELKACVRVPARRRGQRQSAKTHTHLGARYHRLARRRGKQRAQTAVAQTILEDPTHAA